MGGIIYRHKFVFIKSINPAAEHAILFAHGGIRRSQKAYATPVIVPKGRKLVYYAYHSEDTNTDVGWRLLLNNSTYNPTREPKNINPKEFIHADNTTFNYTLSNAFESELALPTAHHDVIGVITRTYMQEVFEAISIYRPAIKYIHCIHCRAVYRHRGSERLYFEQPQIYDEVVRSTQTQKGYYDRAWEYLFG